MKVSVPASSANLGPGFDTLGMALDLPFILSSEFEEGLLAAESRHPASVAFETAGGVGPLWWRSPIPPGRGLGFSGAARVAGALLGCLHAGASVDDARTEALEIACRLEHHPDNASASMLGGVVAATDGVAVRIPMALDVSVVVWWPDSETSTNRSRAALPDAVELADAVFNIGHTAVVVAALAAGDREALGRAMRDRLHQQARLALSEPSRRAFDALTAASPICVWLSGSGPTVAALTDPGEAEDVAAGLPPDGVARVLAIDSFGARILE